jgi:hypothetical protein
MTDNQHKGENQTYAETFGIIAIPFFVLGLVNSPAFFFTAVIFLLMAFSYYRRWKAEIDPTYPGKDGFSDSGISLKKNNDEPTS